MGDSSSPTPRLPQITDRSTHDSIISRANQLANTPIVIYVSSSTPTSRALTPQIESLAQKPIYKDAGVQFYEMELTKETSPMIKFGPQNCPIVFLFRGEWCETLLGIRDVSEVEKGVEKMVQRG